MADRAEAWDCQYCGNDCGDEAPECVCDECRDTLKRVIQALRGKTIDASVFVSAKKAHSIGGDEPVTYLGASILGAEALGTEALGTEVPTSIKSNADTLLSEAAAAVVSQHVVEYNGQSLPGNTLSQTTHPLGLSISIQQSPLLQEQVEPLMVGVELLEEEVDLVHSGPNWEQNADLAISNALSQRINYFYWALVNRDSWVFINISASGEILLLKWGLPPTPDSAAHPDSAAYYRLAMFSSKTDVIEYLRLLFSGATSIASGYY